MDHGWQFCVVWLIFFSLDNCVQAYSPAITTASAPSTFSSLFVCASLALSRITSHFNMYNRVHLNQKKQKSQRNLRIYRRDSLSICGRNIGDRFVIAIGPQNIHCIFVVLRFEQTLRYIYTRFFVLFWFVSIWRIEKEDKKKT